MNELNEGRRTIGKAKEWEIPIVNSKWIFESVEANYCLNIKDYLLVNSNDLDLSANLIANTKSSSIDCSMNEKTSTPLTSISQSDEYKRSTNDHNSMKIKVNNNLRRVEDNDVVVDIADIDTQRVKTGLLPRLNELRKNVIDNNIAPQTSVCTRNLNDLKIEVYNTLESAEENGTPITPAPVSFLRALNCVLSPSYETKQIIKPPIEYSFEKDNTSAKNEFSGQVLTDVTISVSKNLLNQQAKLNSIVKGLGGEYNWIYNPLCTTHFIHSGTPNDNNQELSLAQQQNKIIVSPHWVYACQEQNVRVDESNYPHTYIAHKIE